MEFLIERAAEGQVLKSQFFLPYFSEVNAK
jgi:hypothetical protein